MHNAPPRILMVCMGNICRSPTAEAVLRAQAEAAGVALQVDSAGTHGWHAGEPPDPRSQQHARRRGYELGGLRARLLQAADFERFDWVLVMDGDNLAAAQRLCPPAQRHKLRRLLAFDPQAAQHDVPDPYSGGAEGFETVLDLIESASRALLQQVKSGSLGA